MKQHSFDIAENAKNSSIMSSAWSRHKLTYQVNSIRNVRVSNSQIYQAPYQLFIEGRIIEHSTIHRCEMHIRLKRGGFRAAICTTSSRNKIERILGLWQIKTISRGKNFKAQKITYDAKILHLKMATQGCFKIGNARGVISNNDHIINIKQ